MKHKPQLYLFWDSVKIETISEIENSNLFSHPDQVAWHPSKALLSFVYAPQTGWATPGTVPRLGKARKDINYEALFAFFLVLRALGLLSYWGRWKVGYFQKAAGQANPSVLCKNLSLHVPGPLLHPAAQMCLQALGRNLCPGPLHSFVRSSFSSVLCKYWVLLVCQRSASYSGGNKTWHLLLAGTLQLMSPRPPWPAVSADDSAPPSGRQDVGREWGAAEGSLYFSFCLFIF